MANVSILGRGHMGTAIAGLIERGGNTAQVLGSADADAGPLRRARELEALGLLHVSLASGGQIKWSDGFAVVG